jgi:hypothetical protein
MPFHFNQKHLKKFLLTPYRRQGAFGEPPAQWAQDMGLPIREVAPLPSEPLTRAKLKKICRNRSHSVLYAYLCVMAWGLQGRSKNGARNPASALSCKSKLIENLEKLRCQGHTPIEAYGIFARESKIPGLGPAYFTKLLYFFGVKKAYIMDQWTGKSASLLTDGYVKVSGEGSPYVSLKNYSRFCEVVDVLAEKLGTSGESVEQKMFCSGAIFHRMRGPWRQYVKDEWEN